MDTIDPELRRALRWRERGRGVRVDAALRAQVTAYAVRRRRAGASLRDLSRELGMSEETIRRWTLAAVAVAAPVPVEVVALAPAPSRPERTVAVASPAGYRVDGLSLDEAATLLRMLP